MPGREDPRYPSEQELKALRDYDGDPRLWLEMAEGSWNQLYGLAEWSDCGLRLVTGGWSGNEELIAAMSKNAAMWIFTFEAHIRGGLYVFRAPGEPGDLDWQVTRR